MNKSKVENGEVIETFVCDGVFCPHEMTEKHYVFPEEDLKAFITNALNQQRSQIIEKIKREAFPEDKVMRRYLDEFLTKLEK